MEKFWGENVRSTPMSITSGWTESSSTECLVILGEGVAVCVCLLLSVHHAVMFAIAQLSCTKARDDRVAVASAEPYENHLHFTLDK